MRTLLLEIELPGFYISDEDSAEDVEVSMHLANEQVVVVFVGHEGDSPGVWLRTLEGNIRGYRIRETSNTGKKPDA